MGYGVEAYTVDIDAVRAVCGGGDDQRRQAICGRFRDDIARIHDEFGLSNDRGAGNLFSAIGQLVMEGETPRRLPVRVWVQVCRRVLRALPRQRAILSVPVLVFGRAR